MGIFHKNVNERLAKHLEELGRIGLLNNDWYWNRQKVLQLERIDAKLLRDLVELYKSRLGDKVVAERLIRELTLLKKELDTLLKKHLTESQENEETRQVNNLITDIENLIEKSLPLKIGVAGYSAQKFDEQKANTYLREAYDTIDRKYPHRKKEVVSGLTDIGIPALAYRESVRRGWRTVGIACSLAKDYQCFPCDEVIIVGNQWGEESPTFLRTIDILVRVGGGNQARRECAEAKNMDKEVYEFELPAIS